MIGAEKHDINPALYPPFHGWIDELRISNSLRYTADFSRPTANFAVDGNTIGMLRFDENAGAVAYDTSGRAAGPSNGQVRIGGSPVGPEWTDDVPFPSGGPTPDPSGSTTWYLAEGFTGSGFGTYILIQNPNALASTVDVTYMLQGGGTHLASAHRPGQLPATPSSRRTRPRSASTRPSPPCSSARSRSSSSAPCTSAPMATTPSASPLRPHLVPGRRLHRRRLRDLHPDPEPQRFTRHRRRHLHAPGRRHASRASTPSRPIPATPSWPRTRPRSAPDQAFSTKLVGSQPIIVERAMYFGSGGHGTIGVTAPATTWYLAEGYTGSGFGTYILIQNPNASAATVDVTYMLQGGGTLSRQHTVPGNSRYTIVAQDPAEVGPDRAFSTKLVGSQPIIVERAMYFGGAGHATIGVTGPATTWYLAEGYTGDGLATYILIQNPNASSATVDVTYMLQGGGTLTRQHTVPANARYTIVAQDPDEVGLDQAFSTKLVGSQPIIVERAMYFGTGGHASQGWTP